MSKQIFRTDETYLCETCPIVQRPAYGDGDNVQPQPRVISLRNVAIKNQLDPAAAFNINAIHSSSEVLEDGEAIRSCMETFYAGGCPFNKIVTISLVE